MARAMKDSGIEWLGEIPAYWTVAKVKYFFDIQLGKMLQPEPDSTDDTLEYYLCAANLGGNNLKTDSLKQMWLSPTDKTKFDVRKGDLLVVEGGEVASCDIVTEDVQNLSFLRRLKVCFQDVRELQSNNSASGAAQSCSKSPSDVIAATFGIFSTTNVADTVNLLAFHLRKRPC